MKHFYILLAALSLLYPADSYSAEVNGEILRITVQNNNLAAMDSFINQGADVNLRDEDGNTPLYTALRRNHLTMAQKLIKAGADVNAPSAENGMTPVIIATSRANQLKDEAEKYMEEATGHMSKQAIEANLKKQITHQMNIARKMLQLLIDNGADVNQETPMGTPLISAASNPWNVDLIEILLKSGAQVNLQDRNGRTALFFGELFGGSKISSMLLSAGADVDIKDYNGKTYMEITADDLEKD